MQLDLVPVTVEEIRESARLIYEAGMDIMRFMMARGLSANFRKAPLREPLNRKKKARAERRERLGRDY